MKRYPHTRTALIAVVVALALAGCNKDEQNKPAGQAAAKVNKEAIPVSAVNDLLARAGNVPQDQAKQAGKQVLERLIDQEVLVQQAHEKKLDRDPRVMQSIEAAKREILSRAYLEQVTAAAAKPSEQDVKDYYDKHPELFKERRIYNLRELAINAKPDFLPAVQEQMAKAKSLNDIVDWLKSRNIEFATNAGVKAAEQMPLEILPKFHQLKDGQTAIIPQAGAILVVQLVASQSQPLDQKQATPFIEQFLSNQKRTDLAATEVKRLREAAKIEYVGEFAKAPEEKGRSVMEGMDKTPVPGAAAPVAAPAAAAPQKTPGVAAGLK
jgi:EpsD family peptidyl-prolyl cis-trans isomerase